MLGHSTRKPPKGAKIPDHLVGDFPKSPTSSRVEEKSPTRNPQPDSKKSEKSPNAKTKNPKIPDQIEGHTRIHPRGQVAPRMFF